MSINAELMAPEDLGWYQEGQLVDDMMDDDDYPNFSMRDIFKDISNIGRFC